MMFLARIVPGRKPEVFSLTGALFIQPKSWAFCSYRQGACAIAFTKDEAIRSAKEEFRRAATAYLLERAAQPGKRRMVAC